MLNINMEGSRAYSQHFQLIFSCAPELHAQHKYKYSCALELLAQHNINYSCALELLAQQKTSHQSCASGSPPNKNKHIYIYIYIINNWLTPKYIKQIIMFICSGVFDPTY